MSKAAFEILKIKRYKKRPKITIVNDILSLVVLVLAIYILLYPFAPRISLLFDQQFDQTEGFKYESNLAVENLEPEIVEEELMPVPEENTLVIPKIGVDGLIVEGETPYFLNLGIWHRPLSSTPDKGGNTVLVAHRFMYQSGPNTFYNLDKMEVGDEFIIFWEGEEYDYEVFEVSIVEPEAVEIEGNTNEPIATLYTCTPLWTSTKRLVVKGSLLEA